VEEEKWVKQKHPEATHVEDTAKEILLPQFRNKAENGTKTTFESWGGERFRAAGEKPGVAIDSLELSLAGVGENKKNRS